MNIMGLVDEFSPRTVILFRVVFFNMTQASVSSILWPLSSSENRKFSVTNNSYCIYAIYNEYT